MSKYSLDNIRTGNHRIASVTKTAIYGTMSSILTFCFVFIVTSSLTATVLITLFEIFGKNLMFYLFDRSWETIRRIL